MTTGPEAFPTTAAATNLERDDASRRLPLSAAQSEFLRREITTGALARRAFGGAVLTPVVVVVVLLGLTKLVGKVPLIGWLLSLYGLILTFTAALFGVAAIPVVFLIALAVSLSGRRAKLTKDVQGGEALRRTGTFEVTDRGGAGGSLTVGGSKIKLTKDQLDAVRSQVAESDGHATFHGTVDHTVHEHMLLGITDKDGVVLSAVS